MRRLLLIFLLVFTPLQSIWAAASPYCGHEVAPQAAHFGHHVHDHEGDSAAEDSAQTQATETSGHQALASFTTADMDCHACHGAGSGLIWTSGVHALAVDASRPAHQVLQAWVRPPLSRPERPNWSILA